MCTTTRGPRPDVIQSIDSDTVAVQWRHVIRSSQRIHWIDRANLVLFPMFVEMILTAGAEASAAANLGKVRLILFGIGLNFFGARDYGAFGADSLGLVFEIVGGWWPPRDRSHCHSPVSHTRDRLVGVVELFR